MGQRMTGLANGHFGRQFMPRERVRGRWLGASAVRPEEPIILDSTAHSIDPAQTKDTKGQLPPALRLNGVPRPAMPDRQARAELTPVHPQARAHRQARRLRQHHRPPLFAFPTASGPFPTAPSQARTVMALSKTSPTSRSATARRFPIRPGTCGSASSSQSTCTSMAARPILTARIWAGRTTRRATIPCSPMHGLRSDPERFGRITVRRKQAIERSPTGGSRPLRGSIDMGVP